MIEPFFFDNESLFGCYYPANDFNSKRILIICPPFFDDYRRSYKAVSDLSLAFSEKGVHVFRFDFFATGDSKGDLSQIDAKNWVKNISIAIEEGISVSGADEVILCGIRFGGNLASECSHPNIKRYIYLDPSRSGKDYINELNEFNRKLKAQHLNHLKRNNLKRSNIEYVNTEITKKLKDSIEELKFNPLSLPPATDSYIITTSNKSCSLKLTNNIEFCGLDYDWGQIEEGVVTLKPALEAIAKKVLDL